MKTIWNPQSWPLLVGLVLVAFAPFAIFGLFSFAGAVAADSVGSRLGSHGGRMADRCRHDPPPASRPAWADCPPVSAPPAAPRRPPARPPKPAQTRPTVVGAPRGASTPAQVPDRVH